MPAVLGKRRFPESGRQAVPPAGKNYAYRPCFAARQRSRLNGSIITCPGVLRTMLQRSVLCAAYFRRCLLRCQQVFPS